MTNGSCEQISDLRWDDPICCRVALWLNWASLAIYLYIWFTMEFGGETRGLMRWRIRYWGFRGNGNWNLALPHYDMLWSFGNTPPFFPFPLDTPNICVLYSEAATRSVGSAWLCMCPSIDHLHVTTSFSLLFWFQVPGFCWFGVTCLIVEVTEKSSDKRS